MKLVGTTENWIRSANVVSYTKQYRMQESVSIDSSTCTACSLAATYACLVKDSDVRRVDRHNVSVSLMRSGF